MSRQSHVPIKTGVTRVTGVTSKPNILNYLVLFEVTHNAVLTYTACNLVGSCNGHAPLKTDGSRISLMATRAKSHRIRGGGEA